MSINKRRKSGFVVGGLFLPVVLWAAANKPDFTGAWHLDEKNSSEVIGLLAEALEIFRPEAIRWVKTPTGIVAMGDYIEKPSGEKLTTIYQYLDSIAPLIPITEIRHRDPLLLLVYADGRMREIYTDERDMTAGRQSTAVDKDQKLVYAAWEGESLIIETNTISGTTVLETIVYTEDRQLQHRFEIESVRLPKLPAISFYYMRESP